MSHAVICDAGDDSVCNGVITMPSRHRSMTATTSSAFTGLDASITNNRAVGSIHTVVLEIRVNALGSSSSSVSSRMSLRSIRPGLRPVVSSICSMRSSARRLTTDAGNTFVSIVSRIIHWPATDSTNMPCLSPRGDDQPIDFSCVAPHGTKRTSDSPASICAVVFDHDGSMRKAMMFLNNGGRPIKSAAR